MVDMVELACLKEHMSTVGRCSILKIYMEIFSKVVSSRNEWFADIYPKQGRSKWVVVVLTFGFLFDQEFRTLDLT